MTQQLDMIPTPIAEDARVLERIAARLPKARDVRSPRLPDVLHVEHSDGESTSRHDVGHELVLPERARSDHR
jgi:hypothetical protein